MLMDDTLLLASGAQRLAESVRDEKSQAPQS